ncbi:hypothetical protein EOD39_1480 [Acipenser ruthenus]|uniref:Uncharacterized protein n=1 Tax=Acipenser ruthenus TaxID=7906 RepID=A0A444UB69_ACIRT|nr:hypothetical protein EOD39_1480 [Acipenser ruthenus]
MSKPKPEGSGVNQEDTIMPICRNVCKYYSLRSFHFQSTMVFLEVSVFPPSSPPLLQQVIPILHYLKKSTKPQSSCMVFLSLNFINYGIEIQGYIFIQGTSIRAKGFVECLEEFGSFAHGDSSQPLASDRCLQVLGEGAGEEDRACLRP